MSLASDPVDFLIGQVFNSEFFINTRVLVLRIYLRTADSILKNQLNGCCRVTSNAFSFDGFEFERSGQLHLLEYLLSGPLKIVLMFSKSWSHVLKLLQLKLNRWLGFSVEDFFNSLANTTNALFELCDVFLENALRALELLLQLLFVILERSLSLGKDVVDAW